MAAHDNKAISRRFFEDVWNDGKLRAIDELATSDSVFIDRDMEEHRGAQAARNLVSTYRNAFPDLRFTIEEQIAEGDTVATRWTATGTHRGELMGIPPTEQKTTVTGITIDRIVNDRIAESRGSWDAFGMLRQLGLRPEQVGGRT